jgi:hypothetical protein
VLHRRVVALHTQADLALTVDLRFVLLLQFLNLLLRSHLRVGKRMMQFLDLLLRGRLSV